MNNESLKTFIIIDFGKARNKIILSTAGEL